MDVLDIVMCTPRCCLQAQPMSERCCIVLYSTRRQSRNLYVIFVYVLYCVTLTRFKENNVIFRLQYAHMLRVVALIVVILFSLLKITRLREDGLGRNLFQMNLTDLPELFEHDVFSKNSRGDEKHEFENLCLKYLFKK